MEKSQGILNQIPTARLCKQRVNPRAIKLLNIGAVINLFTLSG